jgi:uncharacterized membrane protein YfhO
VTISNVKQTDQTLEFMISGVNCGWVLIKNSWYPGWQVRVDGKATRLIRANYLFSAVPIHAENSKIELYYSSKSYGAGLIVSASSILVLLGIFVIRNSTGVTHEKR